MAPLFTGHISFDMFSFVMKDRSNFIVFRFWPADHGYLFSISVKTDVTEVRRNSLFTNGYNGSLH